MFELTKIGKNFEVTIPQNRLVFGDPTFSERGSAVELETGKWEIVPIYSEEAHGSLECWALRAKDKQTSPHIAKVDFNTDSNLIGLVKPEVDPDDVVQEIAEGLIRVRDDAFAGDNYLALCLGRECDATVTFIFNQTQRVVSIFILPQDD